MRSVEEHARVVSDLLSPSPSISVPLAEAAGLVLASDLIAPINLPPFPNSAMDGYAVRSADLTGFPVTLPVSQDIPAGRADTGPLQIGTAARIMTGAPMPDGADTIVQVEMTDGGTEFVRIADAPPAGVHVRTIGEDVMAGAVVLTAGTVIGSPQIGVAAAVGLAELHVRRPIEVLVLSTGSELVTPGKPLGPGQIYESNSYMLAAAIIAAGAHATVAHFVADDVGAFRSALTEAVGGMDLIVTSGGVSAGAYEVVKDALTGRGVEFAKVAMQPGMPQGAGYFTPDPPNGSVSHEASERPIPMVTLPGNPVSSYVSFEVFLRPALRAAMGYHQLTRPALRLPLSQALASPAGKRQFRRGVLDPASGTVAPWGGPGSHLLSWLAGADAMIVIESDVTALEAGDHVEVWLLQ